MIEMKKILLSINRPPSKRKTILLLGSRHLSYWDVSLNIRKNYLHPTDKTTMVHTKRMITKVINCLTNLESIIPPPFLS